MSNFTKISANKLVSHSAGVGSIIETISGSYQVSPFNEWPFVSEQLYSDRVVKDGRLIRHLKHHFKQLKTLVEVPWSADTRSKGKGPVLKELCATAFRFPSWHYCPKCRRLDSHEQWFKKAHSKNNQLEIDRFWEDGGFCTHCEEDKKKIDFSSKKKKNGPSIRLVQMAYVMVRHDGYLIDVPWDRWPKIRTVIPQNSEDDNKNVSIPNTCCDMPSLRFRSSGIELADASISCDNCSSRSTLTGIYSNSYKLKENDWKPFYIRDKTSNNLYCPVNLTGIYIPSDELSEDVKERIKKRKVKGRSLDSIIEELEIDYPQISKASIIQYYNELTIGNEHLEDSQLLFENDFKKAEYDVLVSGKSKGQELILEDENSYSFNIISKLVAVKKMRLTKVQIGFTRLNALTVEEVMFGRGEDDFSVSLKSNVSQLQYTSKYGKSTYRLPASVSFGEGIFFSLKEELLESYFKLGIPNVDNEEQLLKGLEEDPRLRVLRLSDIKKRRKFILIHTLVHLIIKELEFACGYSAASLSERLYIGDEMSGALIYADAGGDASYGGLVSQVGRFDEILEAALERAENCSADPVCEEGAEFGNHHSNGAACYACSLLPETTCEVMNSLLDRTIVNEFNNLQKI